MNIATAVLVGMIAFQLAIYVIFKVGRKYEKDHKL